MVSSYTTFCPLSSETVITASATVRPTGTTKIPGTIGTTVAVQTTTVLMITSCNGIVCVKVPVTQTATQSAVVATFATVGTSDSSHSTSTGGVFATPEPLVVSGASTITKATTVPAISGQQTTTSVTQPTTTLLISSRAAVSTFEGAAVHMAASIVGSILAVIFSFV